jgi:integral membrane protein (TIGR01906 family)
MLSVFLITTNVGGAVNEPRLYTYGFERHDITDATNISPDQLERAAKQIRDYFNSDADFLTLTITLNGQLVSLYNERETLHMRDVKRLIVGTYWAQIVSGFFLLIFAGLTLLRSFSHGVQQLAKLLLTASLTLICLVLGIGLVSVIAWRPIFILFHQISFANNLWQLDPYNDYLLMMFPERFFLETTLLIALLTILEAVLLICIAWSMRLFLAHKHAGGNT